MKFIEQKLSGVFLIEPEPFIDDRGVFRRHFEQQEFTNIGIDAEVKQANVSENNYAGTMRGFHYQISPYGEGKTLSCLKGNIYDIVLDLRPSSKTYLKWVSFELNENNRNSIHIPKGCANAFLTLKEDCIIQYYCSGRYHSDAERGIRYNDPLFKFNWPIDIKVISDKDKNWPDFKLDK